MENTYFSNRIYKNSLSKDIVDSITHTLHVFNQCKHYAYRLFLLEHNKQFSYIKSIHQQVKDKYKLNDYYVNSAVQEAKALLSSQKELHVQYISDTQNQISTVTSEIKKVERTYKNKSRISEFIKKGHFKTYPGANESKISESMFIVRLKYKTDLYYCLYDFEHCYLKPKLKALDSKIRLLKFRKKRLENKLLSLQSGVLRGVTFGSKALFQQQFTKSEYIKNHCLWISKYTSERYGKMRISGRNDAKYGNFVFKYKDHDLELTLPGDKKVMIQSLVFKYGQEQVNEALLHRKEWKKPIAWEIEDHSEYYTFKAMVHVPIQNHMNYSKSDGVIGIDCNYDHLAWVETDSYGRFLSHGTIPFDLYGKTTGQVIKILEATAVVMLQLAERKKKPVVVEKLDMQEQKSKLRYRNQLSNRKISQFAYQKILSSLFSRAYKTGIEIFEINPAYTSQIGKIKYMKKHGLSIHCAASYVIARRGMRLQEKLPPVLFNLLPEKIISKHNWAHWSHVSRLLKKIRPHDFYNISWKKTYCSFEQFSEPIYIKPALSG
jgi:IS605 OrfB family transposase